LFMPFHEGWIGESSFHTSPNSTGFWPFCLWTAKCLLQLSSHWYACLWIVSSWDDPWTKSPLLQLTRDLHSWFDCQIALKGFVFQQ
jgi:hypothetical protein